MSLRGRLTLVLVSILAVGLSVSATTTTTLLRAELFRRVDAQLREVEPDAREQLAEGREQRAKANAGSSSASGRSSLSSSGSSGEVLVARINRNGSVVDRIVPPLTSRSPALEAIPRQLLAEARAGHPRRANVTIAGQHYRILVRSFDRSGDVAAVLAPLHDVDTTLDRLRRLEIFGGLGLLVVASFAAWWLVGIGLRPLKAMADTADRIAGGEVDRRVAEGTSRSGEVPRLASALNNAFEVRQRSEEQLRRFVLDASHELRTPLTTISGYAELYAAGALDDPDDAAKAIARIQSESDRMGELVDDLLLLARLDQGRSEQRAAVDLVVLAADAVADAGVASPDWPVTLVAPGPVVVVGDEAAFRQVVVNLLANGSQHCPPGTSIQVAVRLDGDAAVIEVTDNGPGLTAADRDRVFDRFWRADPARSHPGGRHGGSGLGLSIVRAIAEAHGGTATAGDGPRGGARFTVRLPVMANQASSEPPYPPEPTQPEVRAVPTPARWR